MEEREEKYDALMAYEEGWDTGFNGYMIENPYFIPEKDKRLFDAWEKGRREGAEAYRNLED